MGESPTLPGILLVIPPVEVAAARFPFISIATAPTVPILFIEIFSTAALCLIFRTLLRFSSEKKYSSGTIS